eukprot:7315508-Pyramimonas_sp.AAC.1
MSTTERSITSLVGTEGGFQAVGVVSRSWHARVLTVQQQGDFIEARERLIHDSKDRAPMEQ